MTEFLTGDGADYGGIFSAQSAQSAPSAVFSFNRLSLSAILVNRFLRHVIPKKYRHAWPWSRCAAPPTRVKTCPRRSTAFGEAADRGARIVCLQELFTSRYFCQVEDHKYFELAEEIPGPSTEAFRNSRGSAVS